ncbi:MAG: PH domain-containing protein [Acidimicrobiia bacterium]
MPFPRKLLNDGEDLVLDLRPHPWFFAGPASLLVASLVLLIAASVEDWPELVQIVLAGICLGALVWFAGRYARWATTNFVVTSDRIIFRSGVVAKRGIEIPLERVNTIFSSQSVIERMLGSGDIVIESGGELGRETFTDIRDPQRAQNEVYRQIEGNQARMGGGRARAAEADAFDQLSKLDDLRKRGAITEQEFQTKKAQLLDRM